MLAPPVAFFGVYEVTRYHDNAEMDFISFSF
jgi:hypothetical protein